MQNDKSIQSVQAHECLSACIGNMMACKYPTISGNEIVIAGEGLRVKYNTDTKVFVSPMYRSNFRFFEKYGITYQHEKLDACQNPKAFIQDALEAGKYLFARLDARKLTYDRVFRQVEHASHFVNVTGTSEDTFSVCDGYVPSKVAATFMGEISREELLAAWKEMEFEYILFDSVPDLDENAFYREMWEELKNSIQIYRQGGRDDKYCYGKDAITELFRELDYLNRDRVFEVNYQLKIFGFLSLKQIVCEILKKIPDTKEILEEYYQILADWEKVCTLMIKIGLSGRKEQYATLMERMYHCVELEDRVLEKILYLQV